jgi:hypothetical protein
MRKAVTLAVLASTLAGGSTGFDPVDRPAEPNANPVR